MVEARGLGEEVEVEDTGGRAGVARVGEAGLDPRPKKRDAPEERDARIGAGGGGGGGGRAPFECDW